MLELQKIHRNQIGSENLKGFMASDVCPISDMSYRTASSWAVDSEYAKPNLQWHESIGT